MLFKNKYYGVRLESIGGLGANLAGKILGETGALYLGLNAASFASYGSEKRGSPVTAFIRFSDVKTPIRVNSPVERPDLLGIFHIGLAGKSTVMAGVDEESKVVVNTDMDIDDVRNRLKMCAGELYCVDALKIAMDNKTRINMVMLGAAAKVSGFIEVDKLIQCVSDTIGKKYPNALDNNIMGIKKGFECVNGRKIENDGKFEFEHYREIERRWGYKNAPLGGVNPLFGSTVSNDLSPSREGYIPVFDKDKCINCGLCESTCPDFVFQFQKSEKGAENLGINYRHCKGCLRCVEVCPTKAVTVGEERNYDVEGNCVKNIDLIRDDFDFDEVGANSYVESESYTKNSLK